MSDTRYRRVQVEFGSHVIIDNVLPEGHERGQADWFASAMRQRFAGLKTTNEPLDAADLARELRR
jgi:hypothetical protein